MTISSSRTRAQGRCLREALRCWRPIDLQLWPCRSLPGYRVPEQVAAAVLDKQRRDDIKTAELIMRGTPAAPVTFQTDRD